jgi:hypothetical protein
MQKRHLVVGLVLFVATVVPHALAQSSVALAADESASASVAVDATPTSWWRVPSISGSQVVAITDEFAAVASVSDTALMLGAGIALFGLAAGVRRHTC